MKALFALLNREYLEHRTAFVYAPALLLLALFGSVFLAYFVSAGRIDFVLPIPAEVQLFELLLVLVFIGWILYLFGALVFYLADAFSADRRNNGLLFWKSMPQSDLKILSTKMLAALTVFPALMLGWVIVSSVPAYAAAWMVADRLPFVGAPEIAGALRSWWNVGAFGVVATATMLLWYAPFLAWVGMLGTVFNRWAIPLAVLLPVLAIAIERVFTLTEQGRLAVFLEWRFANPVADGLFERYVTSGAAVSADTYVARLIADVDWLALALGLPVAAAFVWLASEYRRRRLAA